MVSEPRIGGFVEDETGQWLVDYIDHESGEVCLIGHRGEERWVSLSRFQHMGPVSYL